MKVIVITAIIFFQLFRQVIKRLKNMKSIKQLIDFSVVLCILLIYFGVKGNIRLWQMPCLVRYELENGSLTSTAKGTKTLG